MGFGEEPEDPHGECRHEIYRLRSVLRRIRRRASVCVCDAGYGGGCGCGAWCGNEADDALCTRRSEHGSACGGCAECLLREDDKL